MLTKCVIKSVKGLKVTFESNGVSVEATPQGRIFVKTEIQPFIGESADVEFVQLCGQLLFTKVEIDMSNAKSINPFSGKTVETVEVGKGK